ncbi:MAG: dTDP-4-dehydrorhamnose reductase [Candidatus Omnitrophica bacterium]|nr:dTDP-4-dehydrorhamnose reductase [Candidatus Omnitrophota bacterium]
MKILVTGADGMVGSALCPELRRCGHELIPTDLAPLTPGTQVLDICDAAAVRAAVEQAKPALVVHLAAATDVDRCEQEPSLAYRVNAAGTEHVISACRIGKARLLYMSTAGVFDGEKLTPYVETDAPNPVNVYGRSKLIGEHAVSQYRGRHQIVRASWMVGGFARDKKFVAKILRLLEERRELTVVTDKIGSLTFTEDVSRGIAALIATDHAGLFHMANQGVCSRYDVACEIVTSLGRTDVTVRPISSDAFPLPAPRAASEALANARLQAVGMDQMPSWQTSLRRYVQRYMATLKGSSCASSS